MKSEKELFEEIYALNKDLLIDPDNLDPYLKHFNKERKELCDLKKFQGKRVLITGISGFVGSHLADRLVNCEEEIEIYGMVRRQSVPIKSNLRSILKKIRIKEANLIDYPSIENAISEIEPHYIFHLAAQSFVPTSFSAPIEAVQTNIGGTTNLLEVIRKMNSNIEGIQIACSSEEYGLVYPNEVPINESNPFRPQSPYAVSKVATEHLSRLYHKAYGVPTIITRGFNHTGPRRGLQFVASVIASQIARILKGGNKTITLGNPKPIRDFTDIRDMLGGYLLAITKGEKGEAYNLGHGFGISIENMLKLTADIFDVDYKLEIDQSRFRPVEVNILLCDYTKAQKELGYKPQYPITETMENLVNYYLTDNIYSNLI
ncbi:MAG: GDP-mannose 4,6-dehydratase [Candidatus Heimdallarchaeota archaeon]